MHVVHILCTIALLHRLLGRETSCWERTQQSWFIFVMSFVSRCVKCFLLMEALECRRASLAPGLCHCDATLL